MELLTELHQYHRYFPKKLVAQMIKEKETVTPLLLEELEQVVSDPQKRKELIDHEEDVSVLIILFLLAKFREKKAFSKILKLSRLDFDFLDYLVGDLVTEGLGSILYSTFDGNLASLKELITDSKVNPDVRGVALTVYGKLIVEGLVDLEEGVQFVRELIKNLQKSDGVLVDYIITIIVDGNLTELMGAVDEIFKEEGIFELIYGKEMEKCPSIDTAYVFDEIHYIENVAEELSGWSCFDQIP